MNDVHFSSATVEWATPQDLFDKLNAQFNFTLDPCATAENAKCEKFYTREQDGLAQSWANEIVFMNPPYGEPEQPCKFGPEVRITDPQIAGGTATQIYDAKGKRTGAVPYMTPCNKKKCVERGYHVSEYIPGMIDFVRKAAESARLDGATVVCLIPARTDTACWHTFIWDESAEKWRKGVSGNFLKGRLKFGGAKNSAPFPSAIVVFKARKRGLK